MAQLAEHLCELGIGRGDRVGIYLPMTPDVVVASHAIAHIGAIQVPLFSGFAAAALAERLDAAKVCALITTPVSRRRGREVRMLQAVDEARRAVPSLRHVVVAPFDLDAYPGRLPPLHVASEDPYLIAYTSGTTGRPKGVVHVQGGFLVSIAREACYAADVHDDDIVHFVTDMGWLMGPWTVVGAGALGATLVLAEGAPDYPNDRLWGLTQHERISVLGVSPTLVRALSVLGDPDADLSSIRVLLSTGEPLNPTPYRWLSEAVGKRRVPIINISGGTEVGACFLAPTPIVPIKECSVGGPVPGMAMDIVDDQQRTLVGTGKIGKLVCRKPFPGMTRGFLGDPGRYLETYWSEMPGVWVHGDWASADEDGCWFVHGRSDDTLNVAGKRLGPVELESIAVAHDGVEEAATVGVPDPVKGEVPWIFCTRSGIAQPTEVIAEEIRQAVSAQIGKAFEPQRIVFVASLPKTRSGKIVRRAIRNAILRGDGGDLSALDDPTVLLEIKAAFAGAEVEAAPRASIAETSST